jgi:membrane protein DedA with SNARE-associated domain/pimeloyl-ACP methyl ester carboxylesterase
VTSGERSAPAAAQPKAAEPKAARPRRWLRRLLVAYLVLLAASYAWRAWRPHHTPADPALQFLELPAQLATGADGSPGSAPVVVAYRWWRPPAASEAGAKAGAETGAETVTADITAPLLLLHGSPGSHRDFTRLAPALAARGIPCLALDFPGFGASSHAVPDYSIRAHARYALALLDAEGIERAHLLGFSMGGGVALEIYSLAPQRVLSDVQLSAIGVQELELFGSYRMNHLLHALQLAAIQVAQWGLPHFGVLDGFPLDQPYARNFFDTDQRPLRGVLERFEPPMLIVHGENDPLVSVVAAREHHRIVPQSELVVLPSDHFMVFRGGETLVDPIARFLHRAQAGLAPRRSDAGADRAAAARTPFDPHSVPPLRGLGLVVGMLLLMFATLVSEDLTSIGAGLLVAQGRIDFVPAAFACFAGIYIGDMLLFWVGRLVGRPALAVPPLSWWLSAESVERSSAWFRRRGAAVILLSRFMPGLRLPTYFAAGLLRTRFLYFAGYFLLAAALWTPMLVALAWWLGDRVLVRFEQVQEHGWLLLALAVALLVLLRTLVLPLLTWRGRRRLVGRWRRWSRWEFWPRWLFYPPVVLYALWLGLRHRGLTLFTAANPGIPAGGVIGESKSGILGLHRGDSPHLPHWLALPAEGSGEGDDAETTAPPPERRARVERFISEHNLSYPLVLKPDVGQRGSGVVVVRSAAEVDAYLAAHPAALLAQEYVAGPEFGLFYFRRPGAERGELFSITEKRLPSLTGDGVSTLERLVLSDERAVILADLYLARLGDPERVPAAGAEVALAELGTHCRGALFLDGGHHATEQLEAAVEQLSRGFTGFSFGRYDVRAPSVEALREGRFQVLELNGVSSEATHIYDPRHSLLYGWRTLMRQWRVAFEIGAAHRSNGVQPVGVRALLREILAYQRTARHHPAERPLDDHTTG